MLSKRWDSRRKVGLIGGFQRLGAPRCQQNILNASDLRNAKLRVGAYGPATFRGVVRERLLGDSSALRSYFVFQLDQCDAGAGLGRFAGCDVALRRLLSVNAAKTSW